MYATQAARELIVGFEQAMAAADETILAPLGEAERTALRDLLLKLVAEIPKPERT